MYGEPAVPHLYYGIHKPFCAVYFGIVGHNGIIVYYKVRAVVFQAFALHPVYPCMAGHRVLVFVYLNMNAGVPPAGAVIVYHEIVAAQHHGATVYIVGYLLLQLRVGALAQQRRHSLPGKLYAAVQYEQRYGYAHNAVYPDIVKVLNYGSRQHRRGSHHVIAAVGSRGQQGV